MHSIAMPTTALFRAVATVALLSLAAASCGDEADDSSSSAGSTTTIATMVAPTAPPFIPPAGVDSRTVEIVATLPHDAQAYTQGLVFDDDGRLFESTGLEGQSTLREVDPTTGAVLRTVDLDDTMFGEGLALTDDRLIQITWQDRVAMAYDPETFEELETFEYEGEGWGLCYDGERLVMSDGTDRLTFRDPVTFEAIGRVDVTMAGDELRLLNELECVDGKVWANLYRSDLVVVIDPATGEVETLIDAATLPRPLGADVMNGIAVDPEGKLWLTGKLWDTMYQVDLVPPT